MSYTKQLRMPFKMPKQNGRGLCLGSQAPFFQWVGWFFAWIWKCFTCRVTHRISKKKWVMSSRNFGWIWWWIRWISWPTTPSKWDIQAVNRNVLNSVVQSLSFSLWGLLVGFRETKSCWSVWGVKHGRIVTKSSRVWMLPLKFYLPILQYCRCLVRMCL